MRHTAKLLPVLLLGSALGGCSMAGTGDFFADEYAQAQKSQMAQYWGEQPSCNDQVQQQFVQGSACGGSFSAAQNQVFGQPYGQTVATPVAQNYQGFTGQNAYQGQFPYQGQPVYQGQQGYIQNGYGASPYVNARGGSSRGLRQSYTYGTLGATIYDVDTDLFGVQGRLGWQSKSLFGAEVEGSFGVTDDDDFVDFGTGTIAAEREIDTQIAAFGVLRYPLSNRFKVLGRVGYHNTEFDASFDDGVTVLEQDFSTDGIAYGVGVEYAFTPKTSVRADYTRYDFDGPEADALSLAVSRKF